MNIFSQIIIPIFVILVSLTFHEASHALVADRLGDPTAKYQGRLSLNPLVHIDPFGTVLLPLLLAIIGAPVFGWAKPVPVNLNYLKNPKRDDGIIAAAGPGSNLLLALVSAIGIRVLFLANPNWNMSNFGNVLFLVLFYFIIINVILMLFNLIPFPPLDGSAILEAFLPAHLAFKLHKIKRYGFVILILLIFTGLLNQLYFSPIGGLFIMGFDYIAGLHGTQ
ncbi:site-2 protease family protein, partial [bacterium]|nr:site-2 protease family protein [candidate division CSSED10-310 bacterium]